MKIKIYIILLIIGFSAISIKNSISQTQKSQKTILTGKEDFKTEWDSIDVCLKKSLTKSALTIVSRIYQKTKESNNSSQFIKALVFKIKLQSDFEENALTNSIKEIEDEIKTAKFPVSAILHSVAAELYWKYYQSNRYSILERSQTVNFKQDDLQTWDIRKITSTVISHYRSSLQNSEALKKIEINQFDAIIEKGNNRTIRPFLFDFLAHRAIDYFMNEESELTLANDAFELSDKTCFADSKLFTQLKFSTEDSLSFKYYAIKLFQDLTLFHSFDEKADALIDVELKRLEFVHNKTVIQYKDSLYLQALLKLEKKNVSNPLSSEISYLIANEYKAKGEKFNPVISQDYKWEIKTALSYCDNAIQRFPGSDGATKCKILKETIMKPYIALTSDKVNLPNIPLLGLIEYKNTNTIYFKILRIDPEQEKNLKNKMNSNQLVAEYNKFAILQSWNISV